MWISGLKGLKEKKKKRCHFSFIQSLSVEIDGISPFSKSKVH